MNAWNLSLVLFLAFVGCYGLAVLAGFTLPNDLPRNVIVCLLIITGGALLVGGVIAAGVAWFGGAR